MRRMLGTIAAIAALTVTVLIVLLIFGSALTGGGGLAKKVVTGVLCLAVVAVAVGFFAYNESGKNAIHEQFASMRNHDGGSRHKHR